MRCIVNCSFTLLCLLEARGLLPVSRTSFCPCFMLIDVATSFRKLARPDSPTRRAHARRCSCIEQVTRSCRKSLCACSLPLVAVCCGDHQSVSLRVVGRRRNTLVFREFWNAKASTSIPCEILSCLLLLFRLLFFVIVLAHSSPSCFSFQLMIVTVSNKKAMHDSLTSTSQQLFGFAPF